MADRGIENPGEFGSPLDDSLEWQGEPPHDTASSASAEEVIERQLAQYAFVREERDREVRLLFRDVPPQEIAHAFRVAGAYLITLMGERARTPGQPTHYSTQPVEEGEEPEAGEQPRRHGPRRARPVPTPDLTGDATIRYFYSLGETVYTVSIASTSGVFGSIAGIYPLASRLEREASERAAVMFMAR